MLLYSRDTNPVVNWFTRDENRFAPPGDPRFPICPHNLSADRTSYRRRHVRFLSHLAELQPELFAGNISRACGRTRDQERRLHFDVVSLARRD